MFFNGAYLVLITFGPPLLVDRGASLMAASAAVSFLSWVSLIGLPLGGWLSTRFAIPGRVMGVGMLLATVFAALLPVVGVPVLVLLAYGLAFSLAAPPVASLFVQALRPATLASGLGIYYLWYYAGSAGLPAVAGLLQDRLGPEAPIWFVVAQLVATTLLIVVFRAEHRRLVPRAVEVSAAG